LLLPFIKVERRTHRSLVHPDELAYVKKNFSPSMGEDKGEGETTCTLILTFSRQGRRNIISVALRANVSNRRAFILPLSILLIGVTCAQHCWLVEWLSYQLQRDRQITLRKSAGHRQRR